MCGVRCIYLWTCLCSLLLTGMHCVRCLLYLLVNMVLFSAFDWRALSVVFVVSTCEHGSVLCFWLACIVCGVRFIFCEHWFKVAQNEVKNASFAQRSAHREGKNMATGIDRTGRRAQATRARTATDVQIGRLRPIDFATVHYFTQLPPIMLGFSESADIGLSF